MTHVVLSLGSNIDREKNIRFALAQIKNQFGALEISPVYETSSVGFEGPAFFNLVVGLQTDHPIDHIITLLRVIEADAGRVRGPKSFDSRLLDIDVILYGDSNLRDQGYNIPRDEIEKYAYVLKPLADLYPDLLHPLVGCSIQTMWNKFELKQQTLFTAEFVIEV